MATPFYSPELENLKKSLLMQDWFKSPYESLYKEQYQKLQEPPNLQQLANLARANISGQTRASIQEAQKAAGSRGFLAGQSGIADRAIQNAIQRGQATLGETLQGISAQAQQNEIERAKASIDMLNAMGQLGQQGAFGALNLGGELEGKQQQFELNQLLSFLNLIYGIYSGEQQQQLARYSPYWNALATIYGG